MVNPSIVVLPGDGIGPEITRAAVDILKTVAPDLELKTHLFGGSAIDHEGEPLPAATLEACANATAVLLGAVGGPKWQAGPKRPEAGLLALRKHLGLFANVRPVRPHLDTAASASSLRPSALEGVDLVVVRELTSGLYFGEPRGRRIEGTDVVAFDTAVYRTSEIQAIAEFAFNLAQQRGGRVTSVDKANVLETSRLWREVVDETHVRYPDVKLDHQLVDSAAMRLITHAREFDVILTSNMFGDILSDEASVLAGSIGVLPSASLGAGSFGLYEPIHGSAPDIAGQGIANPVGMILSAAMMLRHSLDRQSVACRVENAVQFALDDGHRTKDLGGTLTTKQMTEAIKSRLGD